MSSPSVRSGFEIAGAIRRATGQDGWTRFQPGQEVRCPLISPKATTGGRLCLAYLGDVERGALVMVRLWQRSHYGENRRPPQLRARCPECGGRLEVQVLPAEAAVAS